MESTDEFHHATKEREQEIEFSISRGSVPCIPRRTDLTPSTHPVPAVFTQLLRRTATSNLLMSIACVVVTHLSTSLVHVVLAMIVGGGAIVTLPRTTASTQFTPLHLYYTSPTGSDAADGQTPATAWLTPNHSVVCGDVIIDLGGSTRNTSGIGFGTVSNCPSTSGGIDGTGGIWFAEWLCAGPDLEACFINYNGPVGQYTVHITTSNWAVAGFKVTGNGNDNAAFYVDGFNQLLDHHLLINNIAYDVGIGLDAVGANNFSVPATNGFDYTAFIGNATQNAEKNFICTAAQVMVAPGPHDNNAGTHFLIYGNFSWVVPNNGCGTDLENYMFDTFDGHQVTTQAVMMNNIGWSASRYGLQLFLQNNHDVTGGVYYLNNNTMYNNDLLNEAFAGDLQYDNLNNASPSVTILRNITMATQTNPCALQVGGTTPNLVNTVTGTTGNENIAFNPNNINLGVCLNNGAPAGVNFVEDPLFNNTTDLLTNRSGVPSCPGFDTVTKCMGYDPTTSVITNPSVIYDLRPTSAHSAGKGYQLPSVNCASTGDIAALYPAWLKGMVRHKWHPATQTITVEKDLVTKPCSVP